MVLGGVEMVVGGGWDGSGKRVGRRVGDGDGREYCTCSN